MFIEFVIQIQFFSYSLEEFAQILDIPCEGACVFTDKWSLDELAYGVPTDGPCQTNPPSLDDIISYIRIDREGQVRRIRHEEEIDVHEHQILTREIVPTLKPLEEIIQENVFYLGVNKVAREPWLDFGSSHLISFRILLHEFLNVFISYACSDSLLLTPLCCDDIHDVTPPISALAGLTDAYDSKAEPIEEEPLEESNEEG
ncbi:hypothetical protein Tco_0817464 [Tanacetum coccineum]